jgi:hypothetical protein
MTLLRTKYRSMQWEGQSLLKALTEWESILMVMINGSKSIVMMPLEKERKTHPLTMGLSQVVEQFSRKHLSLKKLAVWHKSGGKVSLEFYVTKGKNNWSE